MAVLASDLRHVPAYRLLMLVYQRVGDLERASRVATMLQLLGYAEPGDRQPTFRATAKRGTLSDEMRRTRLVPPPVAGPFTEALVAVRDTLDEIYGVPQIPDAVPVAQVQDPALKVAVVDTLRLYGMQADVWIAPMVPGGYLLLDQPRPTVFLQASLCEVADNERRFLVGRTLEPLRGGYGIVNRLRTIAHRTEVGNLLGELMKPESERAPETHDFVRALPRKAAKAVERLTGLHVLATPGAPPPIEQWFNSLTLASDRAGLVACDDPGAAARMLARLGGEELPEGALVLGHVPGVAELARFYLSDAYHELRAAIGDPQMRL
jgi:hypothetical protein